MNVVYILIPLFVYSLLFSILAAHIGKYAAALKLAFKAAASLLFVAGGVIAALNSPGVYGGMILAALVLGALGDVFLSMYAILPRRAGIFNIVGGACFFAGHILYLVLFLGEAKLFWPLLAVAALFFAIALAFKKGISRAFGKKLLLPVALYALVLGLLLVSTLNLVLAKPGEAGVLRLFASLLFIGSDIALLTQNAAESIKLKRISAYAVMSLYYTAQWIFILTVCLA